MRGSFDGAIFSILSLFSISEKSGFDDDVFFSLLLVVYIFFTDWTISPD